MDEQHPMQPTPEQLNTLIAQAPSSTWLDRLSLAYVAGADAQLERDCKWLTAQSLHLDGSYLLADMRPKPPSLVEQAERELCAMRKYANRAGYQAGDLVIDRALKRLAELEALSDD